MTDEDKLDAIHEVAQDIIGYLNRNIEYHRFTYETQDVREAVGVVGVTVYDRNDRSFLVTYTGRSWDEVIGKMLCTRNALTLAYRSGCMMRDA